MSRLVVRHPEGSVELQPGMTLLVGRDEDADLVIDEPDVSRRHARFYWADGWFVADEGSTNGTFLDGARITAARIDAGAVIGLGAPDSPVLLEIEDDVEDEPLVPALALRSDPAEDPQGTRLMRGRPQPFHDQPPPPPVAPGTPVITLGKAQDNDVVIDDINVSRHHARLVVRDDGFLVEDLNSLNGTLLNAVPVQRALMIDGDRLTVGNTDFVRLSGRLLPARDASPGTGGLEVQGLTFTLRSGRRLIDDVDLRAPRGTLTAVIGPSGAGKSTLSRLLAGVSRPSAGRVSFEGFDLQRDYQAVKTRVGLVPQDDVIHGQLVLSTALRYAAGLRLPNDLAPDAKALQVARVLRQLGLEQHAGSRVDRLSGGQRKRASVALELLTEPSLLVLDEPTSGLDPALDRQVMVTLRDLADGDRSVLVITHSVAHLSLCDQVLVLAPGGLPAYLGAPDGIAAHFGTDDWGDVFASLSADPDGSHERWVAGRSRQPASALPAAPMRRTSTGSGWVRQFAVLAARQVSVMLADRPYVAFLLALSVILGLLPWVVPGSAGLTAVPRGQPDHATEPTSVLALLITGATFLGVAMTARDLVGERAIFVREKAVGLFPSAYLAAKVAVFGAFSAMSSAVMTAVLTLVKTPPSHQVMGFGPPLVELWLPVALTMWVAAALGLAISAFVSSNDQVMPALILVLMVQLVLHGGLVPVLERQVLDAVSRAVPGRWGFAAGASGIDLQTLLAPGRPPTAPLHQDALWAHRQRQWVADMGMLALFGVGFTALAGLRLRVGRR